MKKPANYLFYPFEEVAGVSALIAGAVILFIQVLFSWRFNIHLDGVIDFHFPGENSLLNAFYEIFISWFAFALSVLAFGLIFSHSKPRIIDIAGTTAIAKWPLIIPMILIGVLPVGPVQEYMYWKFLGMGEEVTLSIANMVSFIIIIFLIILMSVYMIYLLYHAFRISTNLKGGKGILIFIGALITGEILSKVLLYWISKI